MIGPIITLAAAYGLPANPAQQQAIIGLAGVLVPLLITRYVRPRVSSPATTDRLVGLARGEPADSGQVQDALQGPPGRDPSWLGRWWPMWLGLLGLLVVVGFGGPETVAILNPGVGGTFTEWLQAALGTGDGDASPLWWVLTISLTVFTSWFSLHLLGNVWPWERKRLPEE